MKIFKSQDGVLESFDKSEIDEYEDMLKKRKCQRVGRLHDKQVLYICNDLYDFLICISTECKGSCKESKEKSIYEQAFKGPNVYAFKIFYAYCGDEFSGTYMQCQTLDQIKEGCNASIKIYQEDLRMI